jgi:hypothetical protein
VNQGVRGERINGLRVVLLSGMVILLFALSVIGEQESNVASIFHLGMGARPLAMGGAFVGLADDGNALFYNPAGLAWEKGLSILSSYEARPGTASYGNLAASFSHFGFGIHYFDFGEVPETDEFGNVIGTFSYSNYVIIAGAGMKAADLPFLTRMSMAENIGFGLGVKFLKVSTLEPGSGSGLAIDLPFLFRSESPSTRVPIITSYGVGVVIENLIGLPIKYGSGHQENWPRKMVLGTSLEFLDQVILAADLTSEKNFHLGLEWIPITAVSFRGGLKYEDIWIWSLGMGLGFRNFVFDFTVVPHPYMNSQLRGSFEMHW